MKAFLSHITEEGAIAKVLKDWIESTFLGQCEVFVSSSITDLPAGSRWLEVIEGALSESQVLLILCSPASIHRPWINFEAGCGWIKRVPILPICHSGQRKGALPPPLSLFQALEIDASNFSVELFSALATHFNFRSVPRINHAEMMAEIAEAVGVVAPNAVIASAHTVSAAAAAGLSGEKLDELLTLVLEYLSSKGERGATPEMVASEFRISPAKAQHSLETLGDRELVYSTYFTRASAIWRVSKEGRAYMAQWGLL
ncbi:MAG TPA: toll/interleukin-1 receptor domain-containing protein [Longimicrobium sp.]|nr:toll/interleukin-1 receptor domain-containing protein [Longimicrobium sp.]